MAADKVGKIGDIGQLDVFTRTGIVRETQGRTEISSTTRTTVRQGGGYIHNGYGRIDPTEATTETETSSREKIRLFVMEQDGGEFDLDLPAPGFGVATGHAVAVVFAGDRTSGRGHPMALVNLNTRNRKVYANRGAWIVRKPARALIIALLLIVPFLTMLAFTLVTGTGGLKPAAYGLIIAAGLIFFLFQRSKALADAVIRRVTEKADEALAKG